MDTDKSNVRPVVARRTEIAVLSVSFVIQVLAIWRGGYVGPDYPRHLPHLLDWSKVVDWSASNPPVYYLLGHGLFVLLGRTLAFPITLSIFQAAINLVALWFFLRYIEDCFRSKTIHLAVAIFLTFLPVRMIHTVSVGADCTTIPMFVLVLFLLDDLLNADRNLLKRAGILGLALMLAIGCKYSFFALLPTVLLVLLAAYRKTPGKFARIAALALILPGAFAAFTFWASSQSHGWNTEIHWERKGIPPDMNYGDFLTVKPRDLELFRVPNYFKGRILGGHKYSYLALVHYGTFTDAMNLFQSFPNPPAFKTTLIPDSKVRSPWKTPVMSASMILGVIWTLLAIAGAIWTSAVTIKNCIRGQLGRRDLLVLFGMAMFLVVFLPMRFVHGASIFGYWTPRLILPSVIYFFTAAFLLIDRKLVTRAAWIAPITFILVCAQSMLAILILS